jgi:putative ABC transport system permease protein
MFWNNIKIAVRNLRKNRLFAFINVAGLALGMAIYILGGLIGRYESTHDAFFANGDRIYTVGSTASPNLNMGIDKINTAVSAYGPFIEAELTDVEAVARTIRAPGLVTHGPNSFYQSVTFADPALLEIFDFAFIAGDSDALRQPSGMILSRAAAIKYFGDTDVVGEVVTLDNEHEFRVAAVIEDVPLNSHFHSTLVIETALDVIAPIQALAAITGFDVAGNYSNLSMGNMTYVLLPAHLDEAWLDAQVQSLFERHPPPGPEPMIDGMYVDPLQHANLAIWDMIGIPVVTVIQLLGLLVLIIACVNYTNLATAQSLGRSREVGMRKTMGAGQSQLLVQFLVESLVIATIAMVIALSVLEIIIPLINNAANKAVTIDYLRTLPWLVATTVLVGLLAGLYPAWLITKASPIDALRDVGRKGRKGSAMRSVMIGAQFAISAFMLALVSIVYMQNERVKEASYVFPRSEIYTLDRVHKEEIRDRHDTLQRELEALPNVESVAYSWQVPYEQNNNPFTFTGSPGDEAGKFSGNWLSMTPEFLETYDIPLLAGRNLDIAIANDKSRGEETEILNVLVNELTLEKLGIRSPQDALNRRIYDLDEENALRELVIVGVVPTQNITGLFNADRPWIYSYSEEELRIASVRISGGNMLATVDAIEDVWDRVIPDYPIQGSFLDDTFEETFSILAGMNTALALFAFLALALAMVGLFGLAAFLAAQRTKEIGVRKVLGASSAQIARLLVWQFSKPVIWALPIALVAAFFASKMYLNFFADRIESPMTILIVAGAIAVTLAWGAVAGHAIRIARANPVLALRYE